MPGKVATVASSINEDCGPIQKFSGKNSAGGFATPRFAYSGVDTPGSSWDRCGTGSQQSSKGKKGKGKSPTNDGGSVVSLFF
jgi:hypothetical protein